MSYDDGFLQFMRDQGAQRAYRNVKEWLHSMPLLDALGKINVELMVIDTRRDAFQAPRKEDLWKKKPRGSGTQQVEVRMRVAAGRKKAKRRRPTR